LFYGLFFFHTSFTERTIETIKIIN
jgi:hypothetical protein